MNQSDRLLRHCPKSAFCALSSSRTIVVQSEVAVDYDSTIAESSSSQQTPAGAEGAAAASIQDSRYSEDAAAENQGFNLYILAGHEAMQL